MKMLELRRVLDQACKDKRNSLTEYEGKQLLTAIGVGVPRGQLAETAENALAAGETLGYPVVMKVHSALISHKTDLGGVITDIKDPSQAAESFAKLLAIVRKQDPRGQVLIERMAPSGVEVIVGMQRDPQFGPVMMFGLGGVYTELLEDVSFRMIPVTAVEVTRMIEQVRGYRLLKGYRGMPAVNLTALQHLLLRISELTQKLPEIAGIDLNPVLLDPHGVVALDCLIVLNWEN